MRHKNRQISLVVYSSIIIILTGHLTMAWNLDNVKNCGNKQTLVSMENSDGKLKYQPDICRRNNSVVVEQCQGEIWESLVEECEQIIIRNSKCPDDLIEIVLANNKTVCLKISEKQQPFTSSFCFGADAILTAYDREIITFLVDNNITSIWLPVRRSEEKEFQPFTIHLPGVKWKKLYSMSFEKYIALSSNKNCVGGYLQKSQQKLGLQIETIDCNEAMHSVCIFTKEPVAKNGCPQNFGALSYRPNECFGISWEDQKHFEDAHMLSLLDYYRKYVTLRTIFKEHHIPTDINVEVRAKISSRKLLINMKDHSVALASLDYKTKSLCAVRNVPKRKNVEMVLQMDAEHETLVLTVYNKFYIWTLGDKSKHAIHCFAYETYGELTAIKLDLIWENNLQTKTMFELDIKNDDPCLYWCEAHSIFNFTLISSDKIVAAAKRRGHTFAIQFNVSWQRLEIPLNKMIKLLRKKIEKELASQPAANDLVFHSVRVMDILNVALSTSQLHCLCHVTISLKSSSQKGNSYEWSSEESPVENKKKQEEVVLMKNILSSLIRSRRGSLQTFVVRSIEYCFAEQKWPMVAMGQVAALSTLCLQDNGLPLTRKCKGNFIDGAYWDKLADTAEHCITSSRNSSLTKNLFEMQSMKLSNNASENVVKKIRKLVESDTDDIIPADLHYLAKLMHKVGKKIVRNVKTQLNETLTADWSSQSSNLSDIVLNVLGIYDSLMNVNDKSLSLSSRALNSTNILLDTFENVMNEILVQVSQSGTSFISDDSDISARYHENYGVFVKIASNFAIFSIDPSIANVSGIAIFKHEDSFDFGYTLNKQKHYQFIFSNQSANDLLNRENILLGAFVPTALWQRLDEIYSRSNRTVLIERPKPSVVIKIYSNAKFFQENRRTRKALGKVVSISIPGHDKDLPEMLPLILSTNDDNVYDAQYCSYWNYKTWATDGIVFLNRSRSNNNTILCGCTHLTPFAFLIGGGNNLLVDSEVEVVVTEIHAKALDIITFLGCSLSFFGIVGIFVTACIFRSWRQKANTKVLMQLCAAVALQMILFCFVNTKEYSSHLIANEIFSTCIAVGACLHYSVLVQFCWMVIIAYLQFKRYVQVFGNTRPKRFFIKSTLFGWGLPIVPVAFVLIFDSTSYIPHADDAKNPICYPSGKSLYIGIVLPIALVILTNLIIFMVVIYNVVKSPAGSIRHTEKSLVLSQIRLLVLLFFLLGFSWIFGLMATMSAGLIFSYLFCLTATLQGFILFLYFILMDPATRRMWCGSIRKWFDIKSNDNSCNTKDTTQSF